MGFEPQETLYKLTWEDPSMAGLEVTVREPSIGQMLSMSDMPASGATVDTEKVRAVFRVFAELLESWNVERKGQPVPADYEGVVSQSPAFITKIIAALGKDFSKPDPTLPTGSATGERASLESSIPMTPSQSSRGS